MKHFEFNFENIRGISLDAICIGKFDGIHIGHQHIINYTKKISQNFGVLTFSPLPFIFFKQGTQTIYTNAEKLFLMQSLQIPNFLQINFNNTFAKTSGEEFVAGLAKITQNIVVGKGFRFGKNQSCGEEELIEWQEKHGYTAHILPNIMQNIVQNSVQNSGEKISSGMLRCFIKDGNFKEYNSISNTPFFCISTVQEGLKLASQIGFPTANCSISQEKIMPPFGVYASTISLDGQTHKSISNYGIKPTINSSQLQNSAQPILETHILNYTGNLYGKQVKVEFIQQIRPEQKFSSINQLQFQISQDIITCKKIHEL